MEITDKDTEEIYYKSTGRSAELYKVVGSFWKSVREELVFVLRGGEVRGRWFTERILLKVGSAEFESLFSEMAKTTVGQMAMDGEMNEVPLVL